MTETQIKYGTIGKELLTITEFLKEFRNMLLGMKITIFTDHKNLTLTDTQYDNARIMRQRLYIEEFGPTIKYIEGPENVAADTLSRNNFEDREHPLLSDKNMTDITREVYTNEKFIVPIDYATIRDAQNNDDELKDMRAQDKNEQDFKQQRFGRIDLIVKRGKDERWRIFVPKILRHALITWYHEQLRHPGVLRMGETIRKNFTWPKMMKEIENYVSRCDTCQRRKTTNNPRAGTLPLKDPPLCNPFQVLTVDLCGPWKMRAKILFKSTIKEKEIIQTKNVITKIFCLTMIDEAAGWPEIVPIKNKESKNIAELVDSEWFCRYPRPEYCLHDNGKEFIGNEFEELLQSYGVRSQPTTIKNPRGNAVHERTHLLMAELIRTEGELYVPASSTIGREIRKLTQRVAFALRSTVSSITTYAPGHLVFNRDMIIHQKELIDWNKIFDRKREQQIKDNNRENLGRSNYEYSIGERVMIIKRTDERTGKLIDCEHEGPFVITRIYGNGTVRIRRTGFTEPLNIRRLKPYKA